MPLSRLVEEGCSIRITENCGDIFAMSFPDFEHGPTSWGENGVQFICDLAIGVKPVPAAIKCRPGIVSGDFRFKPGQIACRDIGRVGQNQVKISFFLSYRLRF